MSTPTEIRLLDQRIPLKTTDQDSELAAQVIELVSARLAAAEGRITGQKVPHQVALLALLDLAEEYLRAKRRTADLKDRMEAGADDLLRSIAGTAMRHDTHDTKTLESPGNEAPSA